MTTQYTPTLKLALPVTGELSGTWGDVVNDNITSMIEQAITGLSTINTWTANAHTLTTANGTTSESRCAMLVAATGGGSPTAAAEIICPTAAKLYVLQNNTSYAVTLKTSAGTGVAVAAGDTAFLFCDSTNVNSCVTTIVNGHITGNLTVDGNATINGNTTLGNATTDTITATARFNTDLLPSTDNARDLGSAANAWKDLFIDGTATMALVAISGGTINGVSIGATTPATFLAVDNLSLDGNTIASTNTNGNIVIAPNGTGDVQLDADTVRVGDAAAAATLTSNGAGALTVTTGGAADLTLSTNNGTNSGTIQIAQGVNGNITLTPNGTGSVSVPKLVVSTATAGRVPYTSTGGLITDSANLLYSGTDLTVYGLTVGRGNGAVSSNTAIGSAALLSNTTGSNNTANGVNALYYNTTGYNNTASGVSALYSNTEGNFNAANGLDALYSNTTGGSNTANGTSALYSNTTGSSNTANGASALLFNTTGSSNTANGASALFFNFTGSNNTASGVSALTFNTGSDNTAIGYSAGSNNTGSNNTAIGSSAGYNTTGSNNTAIGSSAGYNITGSNNTTIGPSAGYNITTGSKNTILGGYNGNQGGLDIRTSSNYIVLSDGDGNPRIQVNASGNTMTTGTFTPQKATTAAAPAYVKGAMYFDTTLNKLRIGGATAWETVTSV